MDENVDHAPETKTSKPPDSAAPSNLQTKVEKSYSVFLKSCFPAVLLLIIVILYLGFDRYLIKCAGEFETFECQQIQAGLISRVDQPVNLAEASTIIGDKNTKYSDRLKIVQRQEGEIAKNQLLVFEHQKTIASRLSIDPNADVASLTNTITELNTRINAQNEVLKTYIADKTKAEQELAAVLKQVSTRYSSRMIWTFVTAVYFLICLAAIGYAVFLMLSPFETLSPERLIWLALVSIGAVGFAVFAYTRVGDYMAIMVPIYAKSLNEYGDLKTNIVNLFNVVGFAAIIFLVGASCSILYQVEKERQSSHIVEVKSLFYEKYRSYIRMILYIGSAMLFVGMFRASILSDWHLGFVTGGKIGEFGKLLSEFFSSLITVQAGFYTIMLAVIYLPVANRIPESAHVIETLDDRGYIALIQEFGPRFIMLLSPFLAKPIAEMFGSFFNSAV